MHDPVIQWYFANYDKILLFNGILNSLYIIGLLLVDRHRRKA